MSASLPQSIALAGLLWLLFLAAAAVVLTFRRTGWPRIRAAMLPAVSSIGATTLMIWAGHAIAGSRGIAVAAVVLLFAILALFARLQTIGRSRVVSAGNNSFEPTRSV